MTITIAMLKRDSFGRPTNRVVEHTATEGHSINAFWMRGGHTAKEFAKYSVGQVANILKAQRPTVDVVVEEE
jgi:hypothetical protein